jgi:hypothetical protein
MFSIDREIEAMKAVRRVAGFAGMGTQPSHAVASNVLRQLDRAIDKEALPESRKLLQHLINNENLPSQKLCLNSQNEIKASMARVNERLRLQEGMRLHQVGPDEEEADKASSPRG